MDSNTEETFLDPALKTTLAEVEKTHILKVLELLSGNRTHAARTLGISVRTLRNRIREWKAVPRGE